MIILGGIPIIGSSLVCAPAAGGLFLTGSTVAARASYFYGAIVAVISDDFPGR